ncbi:MAG: nitroreductase family protein [Ignavibacteria bacterium]
MVHELISKRYSPRAFSDKGIAQEVISDLFEAARWSPSALNIQPWRFIYATKDDAENYNKILSVLVDANKAWADKAPLLILTIAKMNEGHNGHINNYAWYDLGGAVGNMTLEATANDLYIHPMAGFIPQKAREDFEIPDNYEPVSVLAIGYKGNPDSLPENLKQRETAPRQRLPLTDMVYSSKFGQSSDL